MGAVAARLSDVVIVTDDNPRSEEPAAIRNARETAAIAADVLPNFDAVRTRWTKEADRLAAFAGQLQESDLAQDRPYVMTSGETYSHPLQEQIGHLVNHGTQFRA